MSYGRRTRQQADPFRRATWQPRAPASAIKPPRWSVQRRLVAPEWRWAWESPHLMTPFWDWKGTDPVAIIDGTVDTFVFRNNDPKWESTPHGMAPHYEDNPSLANAHHIAHADLPDWFPGVVEGDFTCLAFMEWTAGSAIHNVLQKDGDAAEPYFIYIDQSTGELNANLASTNSLTSTATIPEGQWQLIGCRRDTNGTQLIVDGRPDVSNGNTAIRTNTGALNIGTRSDTYASVTNRSLSGHIGAIYFFGEAISDDNIALLARDPFGPFRRVIPRQVRQDGRYHVARR